MSVSVSVVVVVVVVVVHSFGRPVSEAQPLWQRSSPRFEVAAVLGVCVVGNLEEQLVNVFLHFKFVGILFVESEFQFQLEIK